MASEPAIIAVVVDPDLLWNELIRVANILSIDVRLEPLGRLGEDDEAKVRGGLCTLRGRQVVFVDRRAPLLSRLGTLAIALQRFDLGALRVAPYARAFIEAGGRVQPGRPPANDDGIEPSWREWARTTRPANEG